MASVKLYLDTRTPKKNGTSPLKLGINHRDKRFLLNLNISLSSEQWDSVNNKVVAHPRKQVLNSFISQIMADVNVCILELVRTGKMDRMPPNEIKSVIVAAMRGFDPEEDPEAVKPSFMDYFKGFLETKKGRTREVYQSTFNKMSTYIGDKRIDFEDINKSWLQRFESYMEESVPSVNGRGVHLRNIRAVFNDAVDNDVTVVYPFRKFKIQKAATAKRAITAEQLVQLMDFYCDKHQEKYLDFFMLIFYLIGINIIDLCNLKKEQLVNGRIEYIRAKTHKLYSIKVEPEAQSIIDKYKGDEYLLNILDRYKNYKDFAKRMNQNLRSIGEVKIGKHGAKTISPILPFITTYTARHSWATIAHKIGVSKDVISMALGHSFGNRTTDIYIDYDSEKIDVANRRVIDFINQIKNKKATQNS